MTNEQKYQAVQTAKGLGEFLSIDISIKLFGHEVWSWHFPPKTDEK